MQVDGMTGGQTDCQGLNELLCRLAQHDRERDWEELICRHGGYLRRICQQGLSNDMWLDDAVQEVLLCLRRALPHYHPCSDAEASAWLRTLAGYRTRHLLDAERTRKRRERLVSAMDAVQEDPMPDSDLEEQKQRVLAAMANLSAMQCEIVRLRFLERLPNAEIAQHLGLSPASVQRQGHRALARLRLLLSPSRARRDQRARFAMLALLSDPGLLRGSAPPVLPASAAKAIAVSGKGLAAMGKTTLWAWLAWSGLAAGIVAGLGGGLAWWWMRQVPPAPTVQAQFQDPGAARSAALAQDLIQRFKARHPDWRLTDYGRRLKDPRLWRVEGGQSQVNAAGTAIELRLTNPGDAIRGAALTLVPGFAVDTQPHLLIARVRMRMRPLHTGIRVEAAWNPAVGNWNGKRYEMALSKELLRRFPREEDAPPASEYPDGFWVGILMDREGCEHLVAVDVRPTSPELTAAVQHKTGTLLLELLCRRCPEPQTCQISEVLVFTAGGTSAGQPTGAGNP